MRHITRRHVASRVLGVGLLVFFALASPALAAPMLVGTATDVGGATEYRYTLTNPADSLENIFDLGLFFTGDPSNIATPGGWDYIAGLGFIDWFSPGPPTDLLPGQSLGAFVFQSVLGAGTIAYQVTSADPLTGLPSAAPFNGSTIGPVAELSPIPEPSTFVLLGTALAGLWAARRTIRERHTAA